MVQIRVRPFFVRKRKEVPVPIQPTLDSPIQYLKGVGPAFAKKFEKLGVTSRTEALSAAKQRLLL